MIYELKDTEKAAHLFEGWEETLIYACLQRVMGTVYVTDLSLPQSACAFVGCFAFYAGFPDGELIRNRPRGFVIMVPQNEEWGALIEKTYPHARKVFRYATKKDTEFDRKALESMVRALPGEYEWHTIDGAFYDACLEQSFSADFVSSFANKSDYLKNGRGVVITENGRIVAGASSYARYRDGIEIEVDTEESHRRRHLATAACAALILSCLDEHLYPSWDAQNLPSLHLAEKLGYKYSHTYIAYEVAGEDK